MLIQGRMASWGRAKGKLGSQSPSTPGQGWVTGPADLTDWVLPCWRFLVAGQLQNTLVHYLTWLILWGVSTVFLLDWPRPLLSA